MSTFRLVRLRGEQRAEVWPLATDRPVLLGRGTGDAPAPDVDLRPDASVAPRHARLHAIRGPLPTAVEWRVADLSGEPGTRVNGREIRGAGEVRLAVGDQLEGGATTLLLVPPTWHRLRQRGLVVDLEIAVAVSAALVHWRPDAVVPRLAVTNRSAAPSAARRLRIAIAQCGESDEVIVPPLGPGE